MCGMVLPSQIVTIFVETYYDIIFNQEQYVKKAVTF